MDVDRWRKTLEQERREKDRVFAASPRSPIPEDERDSFDGLAYFPPDPRYRLVVALEPVPDETIRVPRTAGDAVTYTKLGRLRLDLPEGTGTVALLEQDHDDHTHLFLPIRDATSGETTYGAGRYLDPAPLDDGRYLVDLNRLYHPFCAYDDAYTCPLPPPENRLEIPIRAGERLPEDDV